MKTFKQYICENNQFLTNKDDIDHWLFDHDVDGYTINDDLTVDVDGNVDLYNKNLTSIPVQFKNVDGDFYCSYNRLTSLVGCPTTVGGGSFYCFGNQIFDPLNILKIKQVKYCYIDNNQVQQIINKYLQLYPNDNQIRQRYLLAKQELIENGLEQYTK